MSEVISFAAARGAATPRMRIGLLRLTDSAPVIVAHEFGFFADEGLEVDLVVEPSWANIADKLAFGFLDGAVIVPPLAFALQLGLRGAPQPMVIPYIISGGGNAITVNRARALEIKARETEQGLTTVQALAAVLRDRPTSLGIVHAYSTHNLLLRYWLATAGFDAEHETNLVVVPPARAVEALASGQIAGFCAGAPWGEVARRAGVGVTIATSADIWKNAPEKALAIPTRWAEEHPELVAGAIRALLRAAKFCDGPENSTYVAALLSRRKYLDVDSHAILSTLPGGMLPTNNCVFFRHATTCPWQSQALWLLNEMRRWNLLPEGADLIKLATRVYRPDIYRAAVSSLAEPTPAMDSKLEGAHVAAWSIEGQPRSIAMPPDQFCDGAIFDPDSISSGGEHVTSAVHNA